MSCEVDSCTVWNVVYMVTGLGVQYLLGSVLAVDCRTYKGCL